MKTMPRRTFNDGLLKSLFTFSLVETLANHRALAAPIQPIAKRWVAEVEEIRPAVKFSGRQFYLDAAGGEKLRDGLLRVKHLKIQEAYKLYGKS